MCGNQIILVHVQSLCIIALSQISVIVHLSNTACMLQVSHFLVVQNLAQFLIRVYGIRILVYPLLEL